MDELLEQLRDLPAVERARVARELIDSLEDGEDLDADAQWSAELDVRAREVMSGTAELEDAERVLEELEAELDGSSEDSPALGRSR